MSLRDKAREIAHKHANLLCRGGAEHTGQCDRITASHSEAMVAALEWVKKFALIDFGDGEVVADEIEELKRGT